MAIRTRFLIRRLGAEHELFSVRETSDGSLVLMFKVTQSTFGGEGIQNVRDLHTTIHSERPFGPNGRPGFKINYTRRTEDKDLLSGSIIVKKHNKRGFIYPVTSALSAYRPDIVGIKRSDKEDYIELIGSTFPVEILSYTIYGHSKGIVLPQIQGFNSYTHEFGDLALTVYGTFAHLPNYPIALVSNHNELPLRKNGEFIGDKTEAVVPTMSIEGIERFLQSTHSMLAVVYIGSLKLLSDEEKARDLQRLLDGQLFHRWPVDNDEIHAEYGVWSRHRNEVYSAPRFVDGTVKPAEFRDPHGEIRTVLNTPEALARYGIKSRYQSERADN